jgi:hypothetical protein
VERLLLRQRHWWGKIQMDIKGTVWSCGLIHLLRVWICGNCCECDNEICFHKRLWKILTSWVTSSFLRGAVFLSVVHCGVPYSSHTLLYLAL